MDLLATIERLHTTSVQCYGLAVKEALETTYAEEINHGRLYPNLDELIELGLVEKSELDKRTNEYELTDAGRDLLVDRLQWLAAALEADVEGSPTNRKQAAAGGDD
ncbi:MAG: helix-turn-helix transcriptional regulator [Halopenitus sp.]